MLLAGCVTAPLPIDADLLIRGGTVYPGGAAPFVGDVAVRGDRIVAVGKHLAVTARRTIEANGLTVSPGFIDPHAHIESWLTADDPQKRLVAPFLLQGVTTTLVGNDGYGPADVAPLLASARAKPVGINYGAFTGFGSIRAQVIGSARRAPVASELAQEKALVRRAMCDGAIGLSTGLFYAPQSFAETGEVVALARVAGELGGVYDTHLRDEGTMAWAAGAVDEAIAIAREDPFRSTSACQGAGGDVHARRPPDREDRPRAGGWLSLTANQYPGRHREILWAALVRCGAGRRPCGYLARFDDAAVALVLRGHARLCAARRCGQLMGRGSLKATASMHRRHSTSTHRCRYPAIRRCKPATITSHGARRYRGLMRQPWS